MKNGYEVRGEVTAIFMSKQDGTVVETIIATGDLEHAQKFPGRWFACKQGKNIYATGRMPTRQGRRVILARRLLDEPEGMWIDHISGDTLDNRRCNLRSVTQSVNGLNRREANKNNRSSGVVGVTWHKASNKWCAQIMVNRKHHYLGLHDTVEDAKAAVDKFRQEAIDGVHGKGHRTI